MSASNPTGSKSAIEVKNYYSFNGKMGVLSNKIGQEDLKDVPFPLRLLPLDLKPFVIENSSFDAEKGGKRRAKSNMVHPDYAREVVLKYAERAPSDTDESLIVYKGFWYAGAAAIPAIAALNARLSNLFFFAEVDADKKVVLSRLKLKGKASYAFSEARKAAVKSQADLGNSVDEYQFVYTITGVLKTPSLKGDDSFIPVFNWELISEKARAVQLDEDLKLQHIFQEYYNSRTEEKPSHFAPPVDTTAQSAAQATPAAEPTPAAPPVQNTRPSALTPVEDDSLPF